jgi:hypothetical protein
MIETDSFKNLLIRTTESMVEEFTSLTDGMQVYDVSSFECELSSEHEYYSSLYFDEDKFRNLALTAFEIDLDDEYVKDELSETIQQYSEMKIKLMTLRKYIAENDITIGAVF